MVKAVKPLIDLKSADLRFLPNRLCPLVEDVFSFTSINEVYEEISRRMAVTGYEKNFFETAMEVLGLSYEMEEGDLENIPLEGPVIVVANHPLGGMDAIVLGEILARRRQDARLIANYLLDGISELRPWVYQVSPFNRPDAAWINMSGLRQSRDWLRNGGLVGTFPAGMVSRASFRDRSITDGPWSNSVAQLARRTKATVVPVYFEGRNSLFFQTMGLFHPLLRTVLLPREFVVRKDRQIRVKVGAPITSRALREFETVEQVTAFLRLNVYMLKNRSGQDGEIPAKHFFFDKQVTKNTLAPIISPQPPEMLSREIEDLPADQLLVGFGALKVYYARAEQIPETLKEIGRLREITFRQAQEGTGKQFDLEPYDYYYLQLFLWNSEKREIVGGYRLGGTDEIIPRYGINGLYTSKLFAYKAEFFTKMNPALELGRSFIRPEYQKTRSALALVWKGIGEYISRNMRYRILFGAVSTSQDYLVISKKIIMEFLRQNALDPSLVPFVKAKNPPPKSKFAPSERESIGKGLQRIDDVSSLISGLEKDGKGVPVLLRQYLKFNGSIISFTINNDFSNVMESLVVVDLMRSEKSVLKRFVGENKIDRFLDFHSQDKASRATTR